MIKYISKKIFDRLIKPMVNLKGSPHSIALGAAIGMWLALTPTVGIQMTLSVIFCSLFKANVIIACAICWISNPVTFIPMYVGYYKLGTKVLGSESSSDDLRQIIKNNCVIVGSTSPKTNFKDPLQFFKKAIKDKTPFLYNQENTDSLSTIKKLLSKQGIKKIPENFKGHKKNYEELVKMMKQQPGSVALIDIATYIKVSKSNKKGQKAISADKLVKIVEFPPQYNSWWDSFIASGKHVIELTLYEFAWPMWVGSLIIATIIAIPTYPITKIIIIRVRTSLEKIKESPKIVKLREKTREKREQFREKTERLRQIKFRKNKDGKIEETEEKKESEKDSEDSAEKDSEDSAETKDSET